MEKIIIINSGSVSKKYALYNGEKLLLSFHFEEADGNLDEYVVTVKKVENVSKQIRINLDQYENAFSYVVSFLLENELIKNKEEIAATVFRVVAPGDYFTSDRIITGEFLDKLDEIFELAPLHIKKMREEFNQVDEVIPQVKKIAISDSRFHKDKPKVSSIYAIPKEITEDLEIKRYGYHGISISSIVKKIKEKKENIPEKMIICHLGGGSSVTALKNGKTVDTTMGYSPIEGVPMSTRVGNIDIAAAFAIADKMDLEFSEVRDLLYHKSGVKGISKISDDIRDLINEKNNGNEDAKLALEKYTYEIKKVIGSYFAILGGLDLLVFTGTIGERSCAIRSMICEGLTALGIELEEKINVLITDKEGYINKANAKIPIEIIYTEENAEMARRATDLI